MAEKSRVTRTSRTSRTSHELHTCDATASSVRASCTYVSCRNKQFMQDDSDEATMLSGKGLPINARRPSVICVAFTLLVTTVGVAGYTAGITALDTAAETASIDTSTEPRLESEVARLRNELRTATLQKEEAEWRARLS